MRSIRNYAPPILEAQPRRRSNLLLFALVYLFIYLFTRPSSSRSLSKATVRPDHRTVAAPIGFDKSNLMKRERVPRVGQINGTQSGIIAQQTVVNLCYFMFWICSDLARTEFPIWRLNIRFGSIWTDSRERFPDRNSRFLGNHKVKIILNYIRLFYKIWILLLF